MSNSTNTANRIIAMLVLTALLITQLSVFAYADTGGDEAGGLGASGPALGQSGEITAFAELPQDVRWQNGFLPGLPETVQATVDGGAKDIPVTWESDTWNPDLPEAGLHAFTARPQGYTVAEGVSPPTIAYMRQSLGRMAGAGTAASPLQIKTAAQLAEIATLVNAGMLEELVFGAGSTSEVHLELMNNLDLSAYGRGHNSGWGWTPIGIMGNSFSGHFDGGGHTIAGLYINNRSGDFLGLFGYITNATVRNLGIENAAIDGSNFVGIVAGCVEDDSRIESCYTTGSVRGNTNIGGLVGEISSSSLTQCYSTAAVSGSPVVGGVGGIVGTAYISSIEDCAALNPSVNGSTNMGRVVGWADTSSGPNTFAGNIAFAGMTGHTWSNIGETDQDGADASAAELQLQSGFPAGLTDSPWTYEPGRLPGLGGNTVEMPAHLLAALGGVPFDGGDGLTEATAYQISTPEQLAALALLVNDGATNPTYGGNGVHYRLMDDLDLSAYGQGYDGGAGWVPIGDSTNPFYGHFDGGGHTVSGLYIHRPGENEIGLFGYLKQSASVKQLGLSGASVYGKDYVGIIAGQFDTNYNQNGIIENCYTSGTVAGNDYVGGVVGSFGTTGGKLISVYSTATVSGNQYVGGLAGSMIGNMFRCVALNPYVSGAVADKVGRLVGYIAGTTMLNYSFSGMTGSDYSQNTGLASGNSKTAQEFQTAAGFPDELTTFPWTYEAGRLPGLNGNTVEMPAHILAALGGSPFEAGDGTQGNPYRIGKPEQLAALAQLVNDSATNNQYGGSDVYYELMSDLDLSAYGQGRQEGWTPIGTQANPFRGRLDGGLHTVYGLSINRPSEDHVGLLGYVTGGTVERLGVANASILGGDNVGGVVGYLDGGSVAGCFVSGSVSGDDHVGGVAGYLNGGGVRNSYSTAAATGQQYVGGVAGQVASGSVEDCYATGAVEGYEFTFQKTNGHYVGGIAGKVESGGAVRSSAALNPRVRVYRDGTKVARVAGASSGSLDGNMALEGMWIGDVILEGLFWVDNRWTPNPNPNGPDGGDLTAAQTSTPSFWLGMGWDDTVWTLEQGRLPILTGLTGQDGEPGPGSTGFPGEDPQLQLSPRSVVRDGSSSPQTVEFTATGWEGWTNDREVRFTATGGSITSTENGKVALTIPPYYTGTITVTAANDLVAVSPTATVTVSPVAPGAPVNVAAAAGDGRATIRFSPPVDDGGSVITGYTVTASPGGHTVAGTASPIIVTGLQNGTSYIFTVTAANAVGTGPASAPSNPVVPQKPAVPVTGVALDRNTLNLTVGGATGKLTATVLPAGADNQAVIWSSSDASVATVDNSGTVKPAAQGTATITVTTADGGFTSNCTVTVTEPDDGGGDNGGGGGGNPSSSPRSRPDRGSNPPDNRVAKAALPASAFAWDGRTLTIAHDSVTPLGLLSVRWDDAALARGTDFGVYSGSVIIRFDEGFMAAQAPGDHTVKVEFLNHTGEATVTVGDPGTAGTSDGLFGNDTHNPSTGGGPGGSGPGVADNPNTGDGSGIWPALLLGSLGAAALVLAGKDTMPFGKNQQRRPV